MVLCYLRGWQWIQVVYTLLFMGTLPISTTDYILATTMILSCYFHYFMIKAWAKRADRSMVHKLDLYIPPFMSVLYGFLRSSVNDFSAMCVLYLLPFLLVCGGWSMGGSMDISFVAAAVGVFVICVTTQLMSLNSHSSSSSSSRRRHRHYFLKYKECKWILRSRAFTPLPHRYVHPNPFLRPVAAWVKSMLLYNDAAHLRLKHSYPPLNRPRAVHANYSLDVSNCALQLFTSAIQDAVQEKTGTREGQGEEVEIVIDLMKTVCVKMPWLLMQKIRYNSGIPHCS